MLFGIPSADNGWGGNFSKMGKTSLFRLSLRNISKIFTSIKSLFSMVYTSQASFWISFACSGYAGCNVY